MTVWQVIAWQEWRDRFESCLDPRAQAFRSTMSDSDPLHWIRLLERNNHRRPAGMAKWLSHADARPWIGDGWAVAAVASCPKYLRIATGARVRALGRGPQS